MAKSKAISLAELSRSADAGNLAPVYLLLGDEAAIRRGALASLVAAVERLGDGQIPGAVVRLDADQEPLGAILDEARSLPLFAAMGPSPAKLVSVAGFGALFAPRRRQASDPDDDQNQGQSLQAVNEIILGYLEDPVRECCLVLEANKLNRGSKVYKALAQCGVVVDCEAPKRTADVQRWIEAAVRGAGGEIDRDAVVYLAEMAGNSLTTLEHEIEKAMLYAGPGGRIDTAVLEGLTGRSREHSVFELTDALVKRRVEPAIRVLNRLLDDGEHPVRVLTMVAWITRQMVIAHDLSHSGCPRREAMEGLGGRWNQRGEILDRARDSARDDLVSALSACSEADLFVKRLQDRRSGSDKLRPARGRLEALCRQICAA